MASHPPTPRLTPQFCLTTTALSAFLSRSRALTDDTISQNLSAISMPSKNPFAIHPTSRLPSTSRLPNSACGAFIAEKLLPVWAERDRILEYCGNVANGTNVEVETVQGLEDEAEAWEKYEGMLKRGEAQYASSRKRSRTQIVDQTEIPDERLDPYSTRRWQPETRSELLGRVLQREKEIEDIVRQRSFGVIKDRCTGIDGGWQQVMKSWSQSQS